MDYKTMDYDVIIIGGGLSGLTSGSCAEDEHLVMAIGPSFGNWDMENKAHYKIKKQEEEDRLTNVLENRFPGFSKAIRYTEIATPKTIERYTLKNNGAVAGPKQMLGQHMFKRLNTRTEWDNLFCCGESTVMGTGTPTVTVSGLAAANGVLKKLKRETYVYSVGMKNYVNIVKKPFTSDMMYENYDEPTKEVMGKAMKCRFCEYPTCTKERDIRGIMRRVAVGNFIGAKKTWLHNPTNVEELKLYEKNCICQIENNSAVEIVEVIKYITRER